MTAKDSHSGPELATSVCVATFRRPAGLANLLESLVAQCDAPPFEVVVVDNDATGTAAPIVRQFADRLALRYEVEPARGLARVRNRSVALSRGAFLAFIDDDETASAPWLATLHRVRAATRAAAVFGPVIVDSDNAIPPEILGCRLLRPLAAAECTQLEWYHARTSNAYVDRTALPGGEPPFRLQFDRTGGEDVDLFFRMARTGARFACGGPDAAVMERRERARSDLAWVIRRSIRNGGNMADRDWAGRSRGSRVLLGAKVGVQALGDLGRALYLHQRGKPDAIEGLIDACENLGKALTVVEYRLPEYLR